ncbi:MAG: Ca-activated chloride channel [Acidimicrobiaceae bacterium]|nr:Ca-activated chloride channel [Acidimicrobiaceae bacterium]MDQ1444063.1 Ca-activated chloride channel [Acidimicrobiaceae bacterium]
MRFLATGRLWLLLAVAAVVVAYVLLQRRRRHHAVRFTNLELLAVVAPKRPGWRRHVAAGVLLASMLSLVVGFARPTMAQRVPRRQATVMLAIDTSASMQAEDVAPNRLAAAQRAATDFVQHLPPRFRLGLISFDGTARVLVPPTTEHAQVTSAIARLRLGPRTAAGEAVYTALDTIAAANAANNDAARIVLMSDGATTSGRPVDQAAQAAKDAKVPVSTIAFGTDDGTVNLGGQVIPVPVDRDALRKLADTSGGRFFEAASGEELTAVYRDIGSTVAYRTVRHEVTASFTGLGLLLLAAGLIAGLAWSGRVI